MSKRIGIYQITSPSGKAYIGQSWDIDRRWYFYSLAHCSAQRHLYNSIKKYGFTAHVCKVLELFSATVEQSFLDAREQFFMDLRRSQGVTLLNLRGGGSTGKLSDETKERIRAANTGFKPTDETRKKLSEWQTGLKRPHISESNKRRPLPQSIVHLNQIQKGSLHPRFGKRHSLESLSKMSKSQTGHRRATFAVREVMSQKARGECNAAAILTEAEVLEIRAKYKPYIYPRKRLATEYGVSLATIAGIVDGRLWAHLRNHEWSNAA